MSPSGDLQVHAVPLISLITAAYDVYGFQVVGCPPWVLAERFDLDAKSGDVLSARDQKADPKPVLMARLRTLLEDRCKLVVEHSARDQMGLDLEVDRRGLKMHAADPDAHDPQTVRGPFDLKSDGITMADLARTLSAIVRTPVSEHTGLSGAFKVELRYSQSPEMAERTNSEGDAPDVFGALQEQLGLRLVRRTIRMPTLILKHVERPSPN